MKNAVGAALVTLWVLIVFLNEFMPGWLRRLIRAARRK